MMKLHGRFDELCAVFFVLLVGYSLLSLQLSFLIDEPSLGYLRQPAKVTTEESIIIEPFGPLFHPNPKRTHNTELANDAFLTDTPPPPQQQQQQFTQHLSQQQQTKDDAHRRVLVIAAAPRSVKHIVSMWSSLECFTSDVDHVAISAPTWSRPIMERILEEAFHRIPRFASGQTSLEAMVGLNDRYDAGLWCDALSAMGIGGQGTNHNNNNGVNTQRDPSPYDEIALLNDSVYALREYTGIFRALSDHKVSMTSLNYSFIHPRGTGPEHFWLESVWRGFDRTGIRTFVDHSCRPASDPFFCPKAWWGRKGCIVENFERAMAKEFPKSKTFGLFPSDVPRDMLTWSESFPSWVRHPSYWKKLVREQNFPVSKVNWKGMIDSIDDERLQTCTRHLDRSWLEGFDFSVVKEAI